MADIAHTFGCDLMIGPTGDLAASVADAWTRERILRRLLTGPGGYIWHASYGAGLGSAIGSPVAIEQIKGSIRNQVSMEAAIIQSPAPVIQIQSEPGATVFVTVNYQSALTGAALRLTIPG